MRAVFSERTRNAALPNSRMPMIRPAILTLRLLRLQLLAPISSPYFATTSAIVVSTSAFVGNASNPSAAMRVELLAPDADQFRLGDLRLLRLFGHAGDIIVISNLRLICAICG